jgi:serine/threonine protein kinase/tetratricopeptide (TPR) repeat protein
MDRHQQLVEHLFGAALDRPPEGRAAFLERACHDAPELRREVEALLLADKRMGGFLEQPLLGPMAAAGAGAGDLSGGLDDEEVSRGTGCCFEPEQIIAGRFRVVRFIARGGMGEIYEVEDRFLQGVRVALKIILPQVATAAGAARQFEQEVLLARKVIHPNLCPIYDIARAGEAGSAFLFLTMKLLSGETLAARLGRHGSIAEDEAVSMLRQLCAGLGALHVAGVLHRDIKPTNVMVEGQGAATKLCIMDFGLARTYETERTRDASGLLAGTPGYLAPELLRGGRPSQATDIFALGVLLHSVLANGEEEGAGDLGTRQPSVAKRLAVKALAAKGSRSKRTGIPSLLEVADVEFRSEDPEVRCAAFRKVQTAFDAPAGSHRVPLSLPAPKSDRSMTRRRFAMGAAAAMGAVGAAALWDADHLRDLLHPLPQKRFVALLKWPASTDPKLRLVVSDVVEAIGRELSRVEASDRNLLVIAESAGSHMDSASEMGGIRDSFGANLILAASGQIQAKHLSLSLKVLDATVSRPLRERVLRVAIGDQTSLSGRAVQAAAELLGISHFDREEHLPKAGTEKPEAYAAFLAGEALRKQNTAATLEEAIAHYGEALALDPHYAVAMAGLARAYLRSYNRQNDSAKLVLARENCQAAIALHPTLVDAHQVLAWVYEVSGDREGASRELTAALALDPSDPNTLLSQARLLEENGRLDEAADRFARVLRLRPNYWMAHNELGLLLNNSGRFPQALIEFRAASLAAPKNAIAANNVGSVLLQQGKLREAEGSLKRSLGLEPNDVAAANLAALLRVSKRLPEALGYARQAVSLNPQEPHDLLELADTLAASGLASQSLDAYLRAAETCADQLHTETANGPVWMLLALLRVKTGDRDSAPALIEKAEHMGAADMDSQLLKVRTLDLLGERTAALNALRRSLDRGATVFQANTLADGDGLRADPRYRELIRSKGSESTTEL